MQLLTLISASLLASLAMAAPAPAPASDAAAAVSQQIDVWQDADFLGLKFTGSANLAECKNFKSDFTNDITSCKSKPGFRCTVWVNKDCKGTGFSFNTAGTKQLPDWIDNKSKSWKCVDANS